MTAELWTAPQGPGTVDSTGASARALAHGSPLAIRSRRCMNLPKGTAVCPEAARKGDFRKSARGRSIADKAASQDISLQCLSGPRRPSSLRIPDTLPSMASNATRRQFLGGLAAAPAVAARPASAPAEARSENYWKGVRQQFLFREQRVPMNAANLCPAPRSVASAVTDLTRSINVDCSFQNRARFDRDREAARELVAGQLGVTADEIALVRNTSEANNIVNNGLDLGPDE